MDELPRVASKDQKRVEVYNILRALNWIYERSARDITTKDILNLHSFAMKSLVEEELGQFRKKHEGIFTSYGFPIYHAPPPSMVPKLIERLQKFINSEKEPLVPIRAVLAHFTFEKIHPFTDGSGRVGRLLIQMIMAKGGYGMKGILPLEEKIDLKRESYYQMLEESERDLTSYIEFMLETISEAADEAKTLILKKQKLSKEDFLLPRRAEIYEIIKDQKLVNFDMLKRRFISVNSRTLRYDLKKLQDEGLITKLGTTRGVYYKTTK
jgi:Fic family protein